MSKIISISSYGKDFISRSRQINKELFESRLQLNLYKKTLNNPLAITVNKILEKSSNLTNNSKNTKDLSKKKYFPIRNKNINKNDNSKLRKISDENIKFKKNLTKLKTNRIEKKNYLYNNYKTANNSLINKKKYNSNFINNNSTTNRNNICKNTLKKTSIKIARDNFDLNKIEKKVKINERNLNERNLNNHHHNHGKRGEMLTLNFHLSSFKSNFIKINNKSGIIKSSINSNNNNNKKKSRNNMLEKKLNKLSKKLFTNRILMKNPLTNKNKNEPSLNINMDKSLNNMKKNLFLNYNNNNNKNLEFKTFNNISLNKNNKTLEIRKKGESKKNINQVFNNKNNLHVDNVNINNYINCNINYINNNKKLNKDINSINNNKKNKNKEFLPKKESQNILKKNIKIYNYDSKDFLNNKYFFDDSNLLIEDIKYDKKNNKKLIMKERDNNNDSIYETSLKEISKNNFEYSEEESGLLSLDKIEDIIIYYKMNNIKKDENFLFFKEERNIFNNKYKKFLNKAFFGSN